MVKKCVVVPTDVRGNRLPLDRLTRKEAMVVNVIGLTGIGIISLASVGFNARVIQRAMEVGSVL